MLSTPVFEAAETWPETQEMSDACAAFEGFDRNAICDQISEMIAPERIKNARGCPVCGEVA